MRRASRVLLLAAGLAAAMASGGAEAAPARDLPGLRPFPGGDVVRSSESEPGASTLFVEGPVDRIGRSVRSAQSRRVAGRTVSVNFRLPAQVSPREAFEHFARQVPPVPGRFTCEGLNCGRSTVWANDIFGDASLTGLDAEQFYLASPYAYGGTDYLVAVYVVRRGNRAVHALVRVIDPAAGAAGAIAWRSTLLAALPEGPLVVDAALLARAREALGRAGSQMAAGGTVYVVCHRGEPGAFDALVDASRECAARLVEALVADGAGVALAAFAAGPALPREGGAPSRVELVFPVAQ
jgi:hypothetical protein